jgi:hypothetical protein
MPASAGSYRLDSRKRAFFQSGSLCAESDFGDQYREMLYQLTRVKHFSRSRTTIFPFFLEESNRGGGGGNVGNAERFPRSVGSGLCFPQTTISTAFFELFYDSSFAFLACSTR